MRKRKKLKKLILAILIGGFSWFLIHTSYILLDGFKDELDKVDTAVVLGNKVNEDGTPANRLRARLDRTVELYNQGYFPTIIVSGGVGKEGFDEAKVMKDYLVDNGIPENVITEDSDGYNTHMTAENTKSIMKEQNLNSAMIITQYFHITRTKLAFYQLGLKQVSSAKADIFEFRDIYSIFREFPAFYKYLFSYS
ncbi:YdcF family protein [Radiobacillus deserti]|uniref:YdcF family protein n=2 Tax=Radiobacillus deserti TaxID=2594883 RepID=A0A516KLE8_9BACI|nr:YdcF family protein [Radiobacillus deserti]